MIITTLSRHRLLVIACLASTVMQVGLIAADARPDPAKAEPKLDARYPFRTDFANDQLAWYHLKPLEFPPHHSDHRVGGTLVAINYNHRTGTFRADNGEVVDFTMPPFGAACTLNSQASLRDMPLGVHLLFFLHPDDAGQFTRVTAMSDDATGWANHFWSWRIDAMSLPDGKLTVTKQNLTHHDADLGHGTLLMDAHTIIWKGGKRVQPSDLAVGDAVIANLSARTASGPGPCTDIYVGVDSMHHATEEQHAREINDLKARGIPAWVEKVEGDTMVITLFASDDRTVVQELCNREQFPIDKPFFIATATHDLRLYSHDLDAVSTTLLKVESTSTECYGSSGIRLVCKPKDLIEGFRPGGLVRVFAEKWSRVLDPKNPEKSLFGENVGAYHQVQSDEVIEFLPHQFPFRTDFGNESLAWYQVKAGTIPPAWSEHRITGDLVSVDAAHHGGTFRTDGTTDVVAFTMLPEGGHVVRFGYDGVAAPLRGDESNASVLYLDAHATLSDIPIGTHCRFHLYQDEKGAFTKAAVVMDDVSSCAISHVTLKIAELRLDQGRIRVIRHLPRIKNYQGELSDVLDLGRAELTVDQSTRVWKDKKPATLHDLAIGDDLLVDMSGRTKTSTGHCTDIWVGAETQKWASDTQAHKTIAAASATH